MRCLITGVAGFVGSHLAERLLAEGHEVTGIDAFIDYYPRWMKERNLEGPRSWNRFTFIEKNLLDISLPELLAEVEWVFHQAAQAGVRASWGREFSHYVDCNILATQQLLEAALSATHLRRFVYASSSSVYGDTTELPVTEMVIPRPLSPYGVTKLAAENLCTLYYSNFGLPVVSLRYFTVYGPRQRPDMAFHRFCKAIIEHQPLRIYGDGQQTRDFTYISDIVEANILAAKAEEASGHAFNIAGGSRVTLQYVLQLLREICAAPIDLAFDNKQHGDVQDTFADTTFAMNVLGYQPRVDLKQGLAHEFEDIAALYQARTLVPAATATTLSRISS